MGKPIDVDPKAYALRPWRIVGDAARNYTATTFPGNPWQGCELWLRRLTATGGIVEDDNSPLRLDVLDQDGDIIQEFKINRAAFRWLRDRLHFVVER